MQITSLYCGWSGIQSYSTSISGVADNLANESTAGFKGTRSLFHDFMSTAIYEGNDEVQQQGNGAYVSAQNVMTQGTVYGTDNPLDMAISGQGFFTVKAPIDAYPGGPATGSTGSDFYTRAGSFTLDANGFLVNADGYVVQGYTADASGNVGGGGALSDINIDQNMYIAGQTTTLEEVTMNLDASDTKTHLQTDAITPGDQSTYNYSYNTDFYDNQGNAHSVVTYFQKLSAYAGPTPPGSSSVWKVATYESQNGALTANPASPNNVYYLHFDTNGHLVGSSIDTAATGDTYLSSATVAGGAANVSNRLGEDLVYTGAGAAQTYRTSGTITFSGGGTAGTETVSVGGDTYNLPATASDADAANWLADQINANANRTYFAQANAGVVTIYAERSTPMDLSASGAGVTADDDTSLDDLVNAIDNGLNARGAIDLSGLAAGNKVTVAGTAFTEGVDFTDAATLAAAINAAGLGVTASSNGGSGVFLSADNVGLAGNAITLAATGGVVVSGTTLTGGLDNSATSLVDASVVTDGGVSRLQLARTDTGAAATLTLGTANTLGSGLGLDFNAYSQTQVAADAVTSFETDGQVQQTFLFNNNLQDITIDYAPTDAGATTQSAGVSETLYLYQDGLAGGTLQSVSVDRWGDIIGHFSNSQDLTLAAVGLTNFTSPGELKRVGDTLWEATTAAGTPVVGLPGGVEGMGLIEGQSLEASNVDLATEFVNMIDYQRAYQANTKAITTSDEMLKEALNLKR